MADDVTVVLQPWEGTARAFSIYVDRNETLVHDTLSSGSWKLPEGRHFIDVVWGGWFNPAGNQQGGDLYSFWTDDCEAGQIDIGYRKLDPAKPASVVIRCDAPAAPTAPPTTSTPTSPTTTAPPQVTAPTAPSSPVSGQPGSTPGTLVAQEVTPAPANNVQCELNCGIAVKASSEELPFTGMRDYVVPTGFALLVAGCAILAAVKRYVRRRNNFHTSY